MLDVSEMDVREVAKPMLSIATAARSAGFVPRALDAIALALAAKWQRNADRTWLAFFDPFPA